jgi:antitoxin component of MazEF toxin-antitoxin module
MKQLMTFSFALVMLMGSLKCGAQTTNKQAKANVSARVEVYYFHFTRRCHTCESVEAESKKAVEALYPDQVKKGTTTFQAINLDDESSKKIAERLKVSGQSLIVVKNGKQKDLTDKAFMYATTTPEKLQAEIKKAIESL